MFDVTKYWLMFSCQMKPWNWKWLFHPKWVEVLSIAWRTRNIVQSPSYFLFLPVFIIIFFVHRWKKAKGKPRTSHLAFVKSRTKGVLKRNPEQLRFIFPCFLSANLSQINWKRIFLKVTGSYSSILSTEILKYFWNKMVIKRLFLSNFDNLKLKVNVLFRENWIFYDKKITWKNNPVK